MQFAQFARTVGDAAVDQQRRMRESFVGFANHISSSAQEANATWPFFLVPNFELHAGQVRLQSGTEIIACSMFVEASDAEGYLDFVSANYETTVKEAHIIRYGNLDRLFPIGYSPNYTIETADGLILDTVDRPFRLPIYQISPRMLIKYFFYFKEHYRHLTFVFFLQIP